MRNSIFLNGGCFGNKPRSNKIFDISLLDRRAFELSRLEDFVEGKDDIFDVLGQEDSSANI